MTATSPLGEYEERNRRVIESARREGRELMDEHLHREAQRRAQAKPRKTPFELFLDRIEHISFGALVACPCGWFACGTRMTVRTLHEQHVCEQKQTRESA